MKEMELGDVCFHNLQQHVAGQILHQFKEHPEAWTRVDMILEFSSNQQTKVCLPLLPLSFPSSSSFIHPFQSYVCIDHGSLLFLPHTVFCTSNSGEPHQDKMEDTAS